MNRAARANNIKSAAPQIAAEPAAPHVCKSTVMASRCDICLGPVGNPLNIVIATDPNPRRLITGGSEYRKAFPMCSGLIDYFPDACACVSEVSFIGNKKHNPGEPMHHARGKSMDHADCIARHLAERGGYDTVIVDGTEFRIRHSAALAWRAMALLQQELEDELGLPLPRAAKA